jgi:transposase
MSKTQVTIPLDLPDVRVLKSEINRTGALIITVESAKDTATCHRCGKTIRKFHGHDDWVEIRYLPVFGRPTYLRYRPKRYRCENCEGHPTTSQRLDWHEPNSPNAFMYEQHILLQLVNATIEDVAVKEQISAASIVGILERYISAKVDWSQFNRLGQLGLDEIALTKGHGNFVAIVTSRSESGRIRLLAVLPDREKATVVDFLRSIPQRLKNTIECGCCDMYEGYTEAMREELSGVRIVIDRFHVTEAYRDGLNSLRKQELARLKKELSAQDYKLLKGSMWALRKETQDLTQEENQTLDSLPDKIWISMREVTKRDWNGHIEVQEMLKDTQTELEEAQVATVSAMNNRMQVLSKRPKPELDNPEISQAGSNHQLANTCRIGEMALVQVEAAAFLI